MIKNTVYFDFTYAVLLIFSIHLKSIRAHAYPFDQNKIVYTLYTKNMFISSFFFNTILRFIGVII